MNGNKTAQVLEMSRSGMMDPNSPQRADMLTDDQDSTFWHSTVEQNSPTPNYVDEGLKPRMSMYSMKLFDPLMASPQVGLQNSAMNGQRSVIEVSSPFVSLPTPTNKKEKSPESSPSQGCDVKVPSRPSFADSIADSLKNQELMFHEQLSTREGEITMLRSQLNTAFEVIDSLKVANEELMQIAVAAIEKEREEKGALKDKIKGFFSDI